MKRTIRMIALLAAAALAGTAQAEDIKVGGIFDITGITGDVGKPFATGVRDAVAWVNENGGINGKKINLIGQDYAYKVPEGVALYKRLVNDEKVVMINGWGTGDTEALKDTVTKDKSRNPRVAFFYGDNAYGKSPIEAGRRFAKEIGVDVVDEEILPGMVQDATSQLLNMKQKGADYGYTQVTTPNFSAVLRDAKKLGLTTKWGTNVWGIGEILIGVAKDAAEGVVGTMPCPPFGENVPGMAKVVAWHQKNHPNDTHDTNYIRGWSYVMVWSEALKRADKAGKLNGQGIREALETFKDFDLGGLSMPVTYTPADHRPTTRAVLYQVQGGKLVRIGENEEPRKPETLGL